MKLRKLISIVLVMILVVSLGKFTIKADVEVNAGSESELVTVINNATEATIINLTGDITLNNTLRIPSGKTITLRNETGGGPYKLIGPNGADTILVDGVLTIDGIIVTHNNGDWGAGVMIGYGVASTPIGLHGTLYLQSGAITGNTSDVGAGVHNNTGTFYMNGGIISGNVAEKSGGGVTNQSHALFYMNGGTIANNEAENGGGVSAIGPFYMNGGSIINNYASNNGGGIDAALYFGDVMISNGTIVNNIAANRGGGINVNGCNLIMSGGTIEDNRAVFGGAVHLVDFSMSGTLFPATMQTSGNVTIQNNTATSPIPGFGGGGIFVTSENYNRLTIAATTVFSGNTASSLSTPPYNIATLYPNIATLHRSASFHPLNNYDINHQEVTVTINYNANGGSGGRTFSGAVRLVNIATMSEANVSNGTRVFLGWNTAANGSGTDYAVGQEIALTTNLVLYAQWQVNTDTPNTGDGFNVLSGTMLLLAGIAIIKTKKTKKS